MRLRYSRGFWYALTAVYTLGILLFSTMPGADKTSGHYFLAMEYFKNFLHFPAYGGLAWLWLKTFNSVRPKALVLVFLMATSWGIFNEFVQAQTPHRYFSYEDMLVNAVGAGLVIILAGKGVIAVVE